MIALLEPWDSKRVPHMAAVYFLPLLSQHIHSEPVRESFWDAAKQIQNTAIEKVLEVFTEI